MCYEMNLLVQVETIFDISTLKETINFACNITFMIYNHNVGKTACKYIWLKKIS